MSPDFHLCSVIITTSTRGRHRTINVNMDIREYVYLHWEPMWLFFWWGRAGFFTIFWYLLGLRNHFNINKSGELSLFAAQPRSIIAWMQALQASFRVQQTTELNTVCVHINPIIFQSAEAVVSLLGSLKIVASLGAHHYHLFPRWLPRCRLLSPLPPSPSLALALFSPSVFLTFYLFIPCSAIFSV